MLGSQTDTLLSSQLPEHLKWIVGKISDRQFNYAEFPIYTLNNQALRLPPPTMDLFEIELEMFLLHFKDIFTSHVNSNYSTVSCPSKAEMTKSMILPELTPIMKIGKGREDTITSCHRRLSSIIGIPI